MLKGKNQVNYGETPSAVDVKRNKPSDTWLILMNPAGFSRRSWSWAQRKQPLLWWTTTPPSRPRSEILECPFLLHNINHLWPCRCYQTEPNVSFLGSHSIQVRNTPVFIQYSNHKELKTDSALNQVDWYMHTKPRPSAKPGWDWRGTVLPIHDVSSPFHSEGSGSVAGGVSRPGWQLSILWPRSVGPSSAPEPCPAHYHRQHVLPRDTGRSTTGKNPNACLDPPFRLAHTLQ